jgi:hypothetical protein
MLSSNHTPYRVIFVGPFREALLALVIQARGLGTLDELRKSIRGAVARLREAPLDSGEERFDAHWLQLQVRDIAYRVLAIRYAVDQQNRIVYLLNVIPLAGHGLT